jgi:hypothetical protein
VAFSSLIGRMRKSNSVPVLNLVERNQRSDFIHGTVAFTRLPQKLSPLPQLDLLPDRGCFL